MWLSEKGLERTTTIVKAERIVIYCVITACTYMYLNSYACVKGLFNAFGVSHFIKMASKFEG